MFKGIHWTGTALTASGVLAGIGTALGWFTKNVSITEGGVCVQNPALMGFVAAALTVAGALSFAFAPSVKPSVNAKAVDDHNAAALVPGAK